MAIDKVSASAWHPLFQKDLRQIDSWEDWKKLWEAATLKETLLELLHCGFSIHDVVLSECICLYLDVADGYNDVANLTLKEEERNQTWHPKRHDPEWRLEVAQKALRMLVDKAFVDRRKYRWQKPTWAPDIAHPAILEKVIWFFDASRFSTLSDDNLPDRDSEKHDDVVLTKFIGDFVEFCWEFEGFRDREEGPVEENQRIGEALRSLRPQLLEMMAGADQLWYLMRHLRILDKATLKKLREIALRKEGQVMGPFATIEEALVEGKRMAAEILVLYPSFAKEVERQEQLEKAARMEEQAQQLRRQASQQ